MPALHALEAQSLVRLTRRHAEHQSASTPTAFKFARVGSHSACDRFVTMMTRPPSEWASFENSRAPAMGGAACSLTQAVQLFRIEGRVRDREAALIFGVVEDRLVGVEDHGPALRVDAARELGEPLSSDRVGLSGERTILGGQYAPTSRRWGALVGVRVGLRNGRRAALARPRGWSGRGLHVAHAATASDEARTTGAWWFHGAEYHRCAAVGNACGSGNPTVTRG